MGNQRNFSSPSLAKRTPVQHLKPGSSLDKPNYHQNIWNNPFGNLDEAKQQTDMSYLQLVQSQQFPHIPNHQLKSLEELSNPQRVEIYENPSEHYAAIKYEDTNVSRSSRGSSSNSSTNVSNNRFAAAGPTHISHPIKTEQAAASSSVNFYGYGMCYNIYFMTWQGSSRYEIFF